MSSIVFLGGIYNLLFAAFHIGFWKIFRWKTALPKLDFANRGILQILNVQGIYFFLAAAFICFKFPNALLNTDFGNFILGFFSLFWFIRMIQQFIFLRANNYVIHLLSIIFFIGFLIFATPLFFKYFK